MLAGDAFAGQVVHCLGRRAQQQIGESIGEHPVDLLGHRPVSRAQAGLDVDDGTPSLAAASPAASVELTSPATISASLRWRSSADSTPIMHARDLLGVRARSRAQVLVRRRQPELLEEALRQCLVVVLAGVQQRPAPSCPPFSSAWMTGAIFTKFGLVPTTAVTVGCPAPGVEGVMARTPDRRSASSRASGRRGRTSQPSWAIRSGRRRPTAETTRHATREGPLLPGAQFRRSDSAARRPHRRSGAGRPRDSHCREALAPAAAG